MRSRCWNRLRNAESARAVELRSNLPDVARAASHARKSAGRNASIGWLVRELEGDREVVECGGVSPCPLIAACRLRRVLADAKEAFYRELDRYTVTDLTADNRLPIVLQLTTSERNPR